MEHQLKDNINERIVGLMKIIVGMFSVKSRQRDTWRKKNV